MDEQKRLQELTAPLLAWYDRNKRELPWRGTSDPYRIWLSEVMLQQTRVRAVISYYERFLAECPSVYELAALDEQRLFKLWEGLGYYSRARSLHHAAKLLVQDYGGAFPTTAEGLKKLPGIGDYTAAAIASIAFGEVIPAVDGNLLRVAARTALIRRDIMDPRVRREIAQLLRSAVDPQRPGEYNQAMMDLGATVCLPNGAPLCEKCPVRALCEAYRQGMEQSLPVRREKRARRAEERTVLLIRCGGKIALHRRPDTGLLAKLWEFPNVPGSLDAAASSLALAQMGFAAKELVPLPAAKHIFTHIEWQMKAWLCEAEGENEDLHFVDAAGLEARAIASAFRVYTELARELLGGE